MKKLTAILFVLSSLVSAGTMDLSSGRMDYEVKHLLKRVTGESDQVKGRMNCGEEDCEFLLGTNIKTFVSSDSNRDLNMQTITEAGKFPLTSARGKLKMANLQTIGSFQHPVEIDFHGIKKIYQVRADVMSGNKLLSKFIVKLEDHGVERPSLFGVKIENEVPVTLKMQWTNK